MKSWVLGIGLSLICCGCVVTKTETSPFQQGDLEIHVYAPEGVQLHSAAVYVDGVLVGTQLSAIPNIYVKEGRHHVRVKLNGHTVARKTVKIVDPSQTRVLNILLHKP